MPINFMSRGYEAADLISTALSKAQIGQTALATDDATIQKDLYSYWQVQMNNYAKWSSDCSTAPDHNNNSGDTGTQNRQYWSTQFQLAQSELNGNGNIDDSATQAATGSATNCSDQLSSQLALASFFVECSEQPHRYFK